MGRGRHSVRLLMHGYDPVLLETRCLILKQAGFNICTVAEPRSLMGALSVREPYDLLVVCHSVPVEERESIAALAAQYGTPAFQIETLISPTNLVTEVSRLMSFAATL